MRKDAADALESMYKDAKKQGLILLLTVRIGLITNSSKCMMNIW